jgi:hypothetical protein
MEPLFGKIVILERHSVEGQRSSPLAARKIYHRSNLYVFARQDMHFRHIVDVVQHIAFHHWGQKIENIVSGWVRMVENNLEYVLNDEMMLENLGEVGRARGTEISWTMKDWGAGECGKHRHVVPLGTTWRCMAQHHSNLIVCRICNSHVCLVIQ